ncbi:MAG: hypothetical protein ACK5Q5_08545 [Planctomycetaceae bacterium]
MRQTCPLYARILLTVVCGLSLMLPGCAQFALVGLLLGGPPHIEPEFDRETGDSLVGVESKVVVVCYTDPRLKLKFSKLDAEVATYVTRLMQLNRINAVEPEAVRAWIDEHPDWETADEIGAALEADYVVEVEVTDFDLYETHSTTLYRGRTTAYLRTYKLGEDATTAERVFSKDINFMYPTKMARSSYDLTEIEFKREFLSRLGEEIGFMFYPSYNGDKIPWAT